MMLLSYLAIFATAAAATAIGFQAWWIALICTLALWATSPVWQYTPMMRSLGHGGLVRFAYVKALGNAAATQVGALVLGFVIGHLGGVQL